MVTVAAARGREGRQELNEHQYVNLVSPSLCRLECIESATSLVGSPPVTLSRSASLMVTVAAARGRDGRQALNVHQCVPCQPEPVQVRVY